MDIKNPVSSTVLWRNRATCQQIANSYKKWLNKINICTALAFILSSVFEVFAFYFSMTGAVHLYNQNHSFLACLLFLTCFVLLYAYKWAVTVLIPVVRQVWIDSNEQSVYYDTYLKLENFVDFILSRPQFQISNFISEDGENCRECTVKDIFADVENDEITFLCDTENGEQELSIPITYFFEEI